MRRRPQRSSRGIAAEVPNFQYDGPQRRGVVEPAIVASDGVKSNVPALRISVRNDRPADARGKYVLYWMIMSRRRGFNFSLQRAVEWATELGRPLIVLEALRCGYPWANDRIHQFMLDGMADNARAFAGTSVLHYAYIEPEIGAGKGLLAKLAEDACVVITDEFPCFMLPRMVDAAVNQVDKRFEVIDSNGLLPLRAADRAFQRAFDFRRFLQRNLPVHLMQFPKADPLRNVHLPSLMRLPSEITRRWPRANARTLERSTDMLSELPIDHAVMPLAIRGGANAAARRLDRFVRTRLAQYANERGHPDSEATSGLSPYLHFGHISVHQIFGRIAKVERWTVDQLSDGANGSKNGWWRMSDNAEAFLDELVTWRELGYNMCAQRPKDYDKYESLPEWARATLEEHATDLRPHIYSLPELDAGRTHDPLWNAAHRQLREHGWFHNTMRMLWAKKIIEWSPHPRDALAAMIELMNKYSLDGRNPNSYSGYFWALGRYDRPWPERPIFGKVRYMSSQSTGRKHRMSDYMRRH